jgi:hypothetical protein
MAEIRCSSERISPRRRLRASPPRAIFSTNVPHTGDELFRFDFFMVSSLSRGEPISPQMIHKTAKQGLLSSPPGRVNYPIESNNKQKGEENSPITTIYRA